MDEGAIFVTMLRNPIDRAIMVALKGNRRTRLQSFARVRKFTRLGIKRIFNASAAEMVAKNCIYFEKCLSRNQMTVMLNLRILGMLINSVLRFGKYAVALAKRRLCTSTWFRS